MARRPGGTPRPAEPASAEADDDASGWARFLRRLTEAEATDADETGVWARFLRRLSSLHDRNDDEQSRPRQ